MDIDLFIVIGFLVLTIAVGLGNGQKVKNIKDYALGGRNFSTTSLVSTIVATFVTGSGFFVTLSKTYSDGLSYLIAVCFISVQFFILSLVIIPRMGEFLGCLSVAEVMDNLYGKEVRIITAISAIFWNIGGIAVQFKVFGSILNYFLGIPTEYSITITALIVIFYSAYGGVRSVTYTDILQFCAFCFVIPMIGIVIWNEFQYSGLNIYEQFKNPIFDYQNVFNLNNSNLPNIILLSLYFMIPSIGPIHFQRISMGKNVNQIRKAFLISALLFLFIKIAMAWIPFLIFGIDSNLDSSHLISYIIDNYTHIGIKGLIVVGILAMSMSSADSFINGSAVLFGYDIQKAFNFKLNSLALSKIVTFILGIFAIYLALSTNDLLKMVMSSASLYMSLVTVPLLLAIFGFRSTKKSVLIGMVAALATIIFFKNYQSEINEIIPAMVINLIFFIGSHYILKQPNGWIGINDMSYINEIKNKKLKTKKKFIQNIKNFKTLKFLINNSPSDSKIYSFFGIFCFISTISTIYLTHDYTMTKHFNLVLWIYQSMMIITTFFLLYVIWSPRIKNHIGVKVLWNLSLIYMLVICSTFFVLLSNYGKLQLIIFTLNTMVLFTLLRWKVSLLMVFLGILIGSGFFGYYAKIHSINTDFYASDYTSIIYITLLTATALIVFFKPKQEEEKKKTLKINYLEKEVDYTQRELENIKQGFDFLEKQLKTKTGGLKEKERYLKDQVKIRNAEISKLIDMKDEFLRNITHESNTPMTGIISMCDVLYSCYDKLDSENIKRTIKDIVNSGDRLKSYVNSIVDLSKISSKSYKLNKEKVNLTELVHERASLYKKIFPDEAEKQEFIFKIEDDCIVNCDKYYITQTIDNLISNAVNYGRGKPITILVRKEKDSSVSVSIKDQGIGISKLELVSIFEKFSVSSRTKTPAGGRGVGLALCKSVIEEHDGIISATSEGYSSTFTFTLPNKD